MAPVELLCNENWGRTVPSQYRAQPCLSLKDGQFEEGEGAAHLGHGQGCPHDGDCMGRKVNGSL